MDGTAIYNRLKYLGVIDKPTSSSNKLNINKIYPKNIGTDYKTQDTRYKYLVFDEMEIRQQKKKSNLNTNDPYLSSNLCNYSSNYKPQTRDFSSTIYNDHNSSYYTPINFKKYDNTLNFQTSYPREYEVYYFPTSKSITQHSRQTIERFYRRKPIKQYPEEEVPYWYPRYPKPVRVVEREPYYPMIDHGYHASNDFHFNKKNIETYSLEYQSRHVPTNDDIDHKYNNSYGYYYERNLRYPSLSGITRPRSPVYNRNTEYDKTILKNSLLEKKIRDYVWNPHKEPVEKYMVLNYEKSTYYTNFKPLLRSKCIEDEILQKHSSSGIDSQLQNRKNEITKENSHIINQITTSLEKRLTNFNNFQTRKDDSNLSECTPYKNKSEMSKHFPKRISFDLGNDNIEVPNHKSSNRENIDDNSITKDRKSSLGIKESNIELNDKRRTSIILNDDYPVSASQLHILQSVAITNFKRESSSKQGKLALRGKSFESDKLIDSTNYDLNMFEKNEYIDNNDIEKVVHDRNKDNQFYPKTGNEKNNDELKDMSNGNVNCNIKHDSNDSSIKKGTNEKSNFRNKDLVENVSNHKNNFNVTKRRESYKNESKYKKENIFDNKIKSINNISNQLVEEYNDYQNGSNKSSKNIIDDSFKDDFENENNHEPNYYINKEETNHNQHQINVDNYVENENNSETFIPNQCDNDLNTEANSMNSIKRSSSDFETIPKQQEASKEMLLDKDNKQHSFEEHELQPLNVEEHNISNVENNFYSDNRTDNNKEHVTNVLIEPIQRNEFVDESDVHDELYYKNSINYLKENQEDSQKNYVDKKHDNDDYCYQNYSNGDSKKPQDKHYTEPNNQEQYTNKHNEHEKYYYRDHAVDETKAQNENQQYVPNYQSNNYDDRQHNNDDYYYQNYSNIDQKEQYAEPSYQEKYITENNIEHDDYYYQNQPKEAVNDNQIEQRYAEPGHQDNYVEGEQDNYYYEDNPTLTTEKAQPNQYDENTQQKNYVDDQHDDYYYQKHDDNNYNGLVPQEQYDGFVGEYHKANNSYYLESHDDNYKPQQNYENDSYQTQSNYTSEQNPNNTN